TPAPTGGQAPDQANVSGRAGAGSSGRTSRLKGTKPVRTRVTPTATGRQPITDEPTRPASQSEQVADHPVAALTLRPVEVGVGPPEQGGGRGIAGAAGRARGADADRDRQASGQV